MATNALAPTQRRGNRRAIIIAAAFGLLAAFFTLTYLRDAGNQDGTAAVTTVPVVVAVRDIPERTVIKDGMLQVKHVVPDARHPLAFTEGEPVVGQVARVGMSAGEQVLQNKIAPERAVGFSATIPAGKRAVALDVTETIASGGHVAVGDFVDVIGIFEVYDPTFKNPVCPNCQQQPKRFYTTTVLQAIQVLAVAQQSESALQGSPKEGDPKKGKQDAVKTVTLAVSPEQAEMLLQADELGVLRLAMRPFGDNEQRKVAPIYNDVRDLGQ